MMEDRRQPISRLREVRKRTVPYDTRLNYWGKALGFVVGFAAIYFLSWAAYLEFPYLSIGSDLVFRAKVHDAAAVSIFPKDARSTKVVLFGTSRILAGLMPEEFDRLAQNDHLSTYTYNFGLPGRTEFLLELKSLVEHGNAPDVLLLTETWGPAQHYSIFSLPVTDFELALRLFPFRFLIRDAASFAVTSREHGGLAAFYRQASDDQATMRRNHGYYFIAEQSHFPGNRLPASFHLPDDDPNTPVLRVPDASSQDIAQLEGIVRQGRMLCLYVPVPVRATSMGEPPATDEDFRRILETRTPCKLAGPDYFRYPNSYFSDYMHLNPDGARIYTLDLCRLVEPFIEKKADDLAVQ